jgi:hypothetical protein
MSRIHDYGFQLLLLGHGAAVLASADLVGQVWVCWESATHTRTVFATRDLAETWIRDYATALVTA